MENREMGIPYPPQDIFQSPRAPQHLLGEATTTFLLDRFEYPEKGGILVHVQGATYPKKGFPTPQAVQMINLAKRGFMSTLKFFFIPHIRFMFPILLFFKVKLLENTLKIYIDFIHEMVKPFFLKQKLLTPLASEVGAFIYIFLLELGVNRKITEDFTDIFVSILEYDDAYRYRIQDIMSETTKDKIRQDPSKELKRLLTIMAQREKLTMVTDKFNKIAYLLKIVFLSPKLKKAFLKALDQSIFSKFQFDEADRYWVSLRGDYDFFGKTYEERSKNIVIPPKYTVTV